MLLVILMVKKMLEGLRKRIEKFENVEKKLKKLRKLSRKKVIYYMLNGKVINIFLKPGLTKNI